MIYNQADFKPPATMIKNYTDSSGQAYSVTLPLVKVTQIATTVNEVITVYEGFGSKSLICKRNKDIFILLIIITTPILFYVL